MGQFTSEVQKLYIAYFNRPADAGGLAYWESVLAGGATMAQVANSFSSSAEYQAIYTGKPNLELINNLYLNLFGREADSGGLLFWGGEMASGKVTITTIASALASGTTAGSADNIAILSKIAAATAFTVALDTTAELVAYTGADAFAKASAWLNTVTDAATMAAAIAPDALNTAVAEVVASAATGQTFTLTSGADMVNAAGSTTAVDTVKGTLGNTNLTSSLVGTFSLGDTIVGNGLTKLELLVSSEASDANTSLVEMSGVNSIALKAAALNSVELDGSAFGVDVSTVSASGVRAATLGVTGLTTEGAFTLQTAATYGGTLYVGDVDFDNTGRADIASDNSIVGQDDIAFVAGSISTDLYSAPGVDANLYIDAGANGGGSSVRLLEDEIEVNAGAGRDALANGGDSAGAHVFNYVNATDDLITAPEISVALVDINVAKGSLGEVVISNFVEKTADIGDAQALGVMVDAVEIDIEDGAAALFEVRNIAANYVDGDAGSVNPAVFAGDIEIGQINADAKTDSTVDIKVLQLASLMNRGSNSVESATAGNVTIGHVNASGNGTQAGDLAIEIVNGVELTGNGDIAVNVGAMNIADVVASGWNDVSVTIVNAVDFGAVTADADLDATATIGNMTVGSVSLDGSMDVTLTITDGNNTSGEAQGSVTLGVMTVGNISVDSGDDGTVNISRNALAIDESATIGQTNIAVGGTVEIHSDETSDFALQIHALGYGESAIGRVRVGNLDVGSEAGSVDIDIVSEVWMSQDATAVGSANVANVTIGNVTVAASNSSSNNAEAYILIKADAALDTGILVVDDRLGASATIGNVSIGSVSAVMAGTADDSSVDAFVEITVEADSVLADATVGTVTLGNLTAQAEDGAHINVTVSATADRGNAELGNILIGDVTVVNVDGNTETDTDSADLNINVLARADNTADVNATVGTVSIGDITMSGGADDEAVNVNVVINISAQANVTGLAVDSGSSVATVGMVTIGDLNMTAGGEGSIDVSIDVFALVRDGDDSGGGLANGTATITGLEVGAMNLTVTGTDSVDVSYDVSAFVANDGAASVTNVTLGNMYMASTVDEVSLDIAIDAQVDGVGIASVTNINIGDISQVAGTDASVGITVTAAAGTSGTASVSEIEIGSITQVATDRADVDVIVSADAENSATVSRVQIGEIDLSSAEDTASVDIAIYALAAEGAAVSEVTISDVTVSGGVSGTININVWGEDWIGTGDASVSVLSVGDLTANGVDGDGEVNVDVGAYSEVGSASVDDVTIGNINAVSNYTDANVSVDISAVQGGMTISGEDDLTGVATVSDVTVGDIYAGTVGGTGAFGTDVSDVDVSVEVRAYGNDASISDVTFGSVRGEAVDSRDVNVVIEVIAHANDMSFSGPWSNNSEGSATISDVTFGDISAISTGDADMQIDVEAHASVTADMVDKNASVTGLTIGNINLEGSSSDLTISVSADLTSTGSTQRSALIDDVTIGNVTVLNVGDEGNSHSIDIGFSVESAASIGTRGTALIDNVTLGDIDMSAGSGDSGEYDIDVSFNARGEQSGSIGSVTLGDVTMAVNDDVNVRVNLTFLANVDSTGADEGDIESVTVGDVTIAVGDNADDDFSATFTGSTAGILVQALDDIVNVDIGTWTISAGADSTIEDHDIRVLAGNNVNGFIDTVSIEGVALSAVGDSSFIYSNIVVDGNRLINAVDIGNMTIDVVGDDSSASINVSIDATDIESVTVGDITVNATGDSAWAYALLDVSAGEDLGSVTVGDVSVSANGLNSTASVDISVTANGVLSGTASLTVGNLTIDSNGVSAYASVDISTSVSSNTGSSSIDIGDIAMSVVGSQATASLNVSLSDDWSMDGGNVTMGNIVATLSNSADAGRDVYSIGNDRADAEIQVHVTSDFSAEIGDITISSLVVGDAGRINTAGVQADFNVNADDDITIGDITVVGGLYADSGLSGISGSNDTGIFNVSVTASGHTVVVASGEDTDTVWVPGTVLNVDDDIRLGFEYFQNDDVWRLQDVTFTPGVSSQFNIVEIGYTSYIYANLNSGDYLVNDLIATVSMSGQADGGTVTIDWDDTNVGSTASAEIDISFAGVHDLFNDTDYVSVSLESGEVGEIIYDAARLELLDNFQVLTEWLDLSAGGIVDIGDVDYSGYAALADADGYVVIDVSGTTGAANIIGAQGDTVFIGNNDANNFTAHGGTDVFIIGDAQSGITLATADKINAFSTANDVLVLDLAGDIIGGDVNYVEAGSAVADFDAALAAANVALASLDGTSTATELYSFQFDGTNGYLFESTDGNGTADQVIVLVGIDASEFSVSNLSSSFIS